MELADAFQMVINLAKRSLNGAEAASEGYLEQLEAIHQLEDFALNHLGDD